MIDWKKSMAQSFEFFEVDPGTWQNARLIRGIVSAEITFDMDSDTGGRATFEMTEDVGEAYIRAYLIAEQAGEQERHPLGTFLAQTSSRETGSAIATYSVDAYTPLLELADDGPEAGYTVALTDDLFRSIADECALHCRAPVTRGASKAPSDRAYSAEPGESWLDFLGALCEAAQSRLFCDQLGQIIMLPIRDVTAMQPRATFDDGSASIVQPGTVDEHDLYGIPNSITVIYSTDAGHMSATAVNDNPASPVSVQARGRVVSARDTSPKVPGGLEGEAVREWLKAEASRQLAAASAVTREAVYTRGFMPGIRVGDCVRLDFNRAGIHAKALVVSQTVSCETGYQVEETVRWTEAVA